MENLYPYLPYILTMAPSIAIVIVYLSLTFFVSVFVDWDVRGGLLRMIIMIGLTGLIFFISMTIGTMLRDELPVAIMRSSAYNMNIHEEFLIALCVEMIGAIIFVPFIYGTDEHPQFIVLSLVFSLIFLSVFFIFPIETYARELFDLRLSIIRNYVENFRVELLSILVLFFFYSAIRILGVAALKGKLIRYGQLIVMAAIVSGFVWYYREIILEPEYENLYLALWAGVISIIVLIIAKLNDKLLLLIIFFTAVTTIVLLIGTQLPDFQFDPPTSINIAAELVGAIAVALVLDTDMDV